MGVLLLILFLGDQWLGIEDLSAEEDDGRKVTLLTVVFNTFVWFQIFNEVNARRVNNEKNVFEGIFKNMIFWGVIAVTVVCQVLFIEACGDFCATTRLNGEQWAMSIGFGAGELI